jgi:pseudaminic acid biosynthesis-associated methylase
LSTKISPKTEQIRTWSGDFGREYTDRNNYTPLQLDELYRKTYGVTRREVNQRLLERVPKDARILEVGCNMGTQLLLLKEMGFTDLSGIEIQSYALGRAQERLPDAQSLQASALSIPFEDQHFDLVFTSGVLIHIAPADLPIAMSEIHRCAKHWIWGFEYYAPQMTEVVYRGNNGLLWKTDYARFYLEQFDGLELVREERLRYLENENVDATFLLHRKEQRGRRVRRHH